MDSMKRSASARGSSIQEVVFILLELDWKPTMMYNRSLFDLRRPL